VRVDSLWHRSTKKMINKPNYHHATRTAVGLPSTAD